MTPFASSFRAAAAWALAALLAGCSALPQPPQRAELFDFGPGAQAAAARAGAAPPVLVLAEVTRAGVADTSSALHYRLAYADAQQLRPYVRARWSQPPAQLLRDALAARLAQERVLLLAPEGLGVQARDGAPAQLLRVQLEEFSQQFDRPDASSAVLRLRATHSQLDAQGERVLAQRVFALRERAPSHDAAGGAHALAAASRRVADEIAAWLAAPPP